MIEHSSDEVKQMVSTSKYMVSTSNERLRASVRANDHECSGDDLESMRARVCAAHAGAEHSESQATKHRPSDERIALEQLF